MVTTGRRRITYTRGLIDLDCRPMRASAPATDFRPYVMEPAILC